METKIIETPIDGVKVELKKWITGEEGIEIEKPITDIKMSVNSSGMSDASVNLGEAYRQSTNNAISVIVVSIDNDKENILDRIKKMKRPDYLFITKEIDKIVRGVDFTKPTKE